LQLQYGAATVNFSSSKEPGGSFDLVMAAGEEIAEKLTQFYLFGEIDLSSISARKDYSPGPVFWEKNRRSFEARRFMRYIVAASKSTVVNTGSTV